MIGRMVRINSVPTRVIGVMPKGIEVPPETQVWLPLIPSAAMQKDRSDRSLNVFGRLASNATPAYRTAIVTLLLGVPLITTRTDTALPGVTPCGILTLICHRPTYPGARPEY